MQVVEMAGRRFGMLTVLMRKGTRFTFAAWLVRCDCGVTKVVAGNELRRGSTTSCGCNRERARLAAVVTHGEAHTPTWNSWIAMKGRCNRKTDPSFARYGGRGIRVCKRWSSSYEAFVEDMGHRPSMRHTIDRKDVNGHYEPGNCRWATKRQQSLNRRNNLRLTYGGETLTLSEWATRTGLRRTTISQRLRYGYTLHEALTSPILSLSERGKRRWDKARKR